VAYFKLSTQYLNIGIAETTKNSSQKIQPSDLEFNSRPQEYEAGELSATPVPTLNQMNPVHTPPRGKNPKPVPTLNQMNPVHPPPPYYFFKTHLILSSYLYPGLLSDFFPSGFSTKFCMRSSYLLLAVLSEELSQ
jgi:hypothetical protein